MPDNEKMDLLISQSMGQNGQATFRTLDEIVAWLKRERQFWQWLSKAARQDPAIKQGWDKISNKLTELQKIHDEAVKFQDTEHYDARINALRNKFGEMSDDSNVILSKNPKALYVEELRSKSGDRIAGYCVAMFLNCGVTANNPQSIYGSVAAVLYLRGIGGNADAELEALTTLKSEYGTEFSQYSESHESLVKDQAKLAELLRQTIEAGRSKFETNVAAATNTLEQIITTSGDSLKEFVDAREEEINEFKKQSSIEWEAIKESFTDQMSLQAPVSYWEGQVVTHRGRSQNYAIASAVWLFFATLGLYFAADWLLEEQAGNIVGGTIGSFLGLPVWHIVVFLIFSSAAIWVARVLVRLLLSEIHLTKDAAERVVMVKTYIALLKEGQGPVDQDRSLILQTLFRPSTYGVLNDESHPVLPIEWMQNILNRNS